MARSWTKARCWVVWTMGGFSLFSPVLVARTTLCSFPHHGCGVEKPLLCKAGAVSWLSRRCYWLLNVLRVGMDSV